MRRNLILAALPLFIARTAEAQEINLTGPLSSGPAPIDVRADVELEAGLLVRFASVDDPYDGTTVPAIGFSSRFMFARGNSVTDRHELWQGITTSFAYAAGPHFGFVDEEYERQCFFDVGYMLGGDLATNVFRLNGALGLAAALTDAATSERNPGVLGSDRGALGPSVSLVGQSRFGPWSWQPKRIIVTASLALRDLHQLSGAANRFEVFSAMLGVGIDVPAGSIR